MVIKQGSRIAVIGAGISGIAAASVLKKNGFTPVVFEKHKKIGGVWATAYPGVHLQNIYTQYHLSDFDWPFKPDLHPSGEQIMRYLEEAVRHLRLDLRLEHEVLSMTEEADGWRLCYQNKEGVHEEFFSYVLLAAGQYTDGKNLPDYLDQELFKGRIITERDITSLDVFKDKRVVVVGYGKSALDMATLAAESAAQVWHVFRAANWLIPEWILGAHFTHALFTRFGNVMMTSWAQPTAAERLLHTRLSFVISGFWDMIQSIVLYQLKRTGKGKDAAAQERLKTLIPGHKILMDFRSSGALGPENYYPLVAEGKILPYRTEIECFSPDAVQLKNGRVIPCDFVVLSTGYLTPTFPFLPDLYRVLLEAEKDGPQLYRHMLQPRIPRLAFAGFNHGYMHVPSVEIGTQWLCAYLRGELVLPPPEEMERSIEYVRNWKRENIKFENARSCAVSTRFQQYIDILLKELGVSPYRKLPNPIAELFSRYEASDYRGVYEEYERARAKRTAPLNVLPLDT
ncbi:MAG TPA: NAD(P)/FAD-dependent oxidoreductase [Anaerolineales bacterium]|nr:NAD(P)/FAD-dependent oxidoreductase [Anaerolineales bacterium]